MAPPREEPPEPPPPPPPPSLLPAELPRPEPPRETPTLPDRQLPASAAKSSLISNLLEQRHESLRRDDAWSLRAKAVWESTRSYTDDEAGRVVARFGAVKVTRRQVENRHEQLCGVKLKDLELTPEQARERVEAIVEGFLLPEIEVAEAERRGYAAKPGIRMSRLCSALVTSDDVQEYYRHHKDAYPGKTLAQAWGQIEDLLMTAQMARSRQRLEESLAALRDTATIDRHFDLLEQPSPPDSAVLFSLNGTDYTMAQWREELAALPNVPRTSADKRHYADALIDRILILSSTKGIADETLRQQLEQQRRENLTHLLRQEEVEDRIQLTDDALRQLYQQATAKGNLVRLGFLEVGWIGLKLAQGNDAGGAARQRLAAIRKEVEAAGDFETVAQKHAAASNGEFRMGRREYVLSDSPLALLNAPPPEASLLREGQTSQPVVYEQEGYAYLFHVFDRQPRRPMTFEEARPFMESELWDLERAKRSQEFDQELINGAHIEYDEDTVADIVKRATGRRPPAPGPKDRRAQRLDEHSVQPAGG